MGKRRGRKLLVASLGVGAVSYVACAGSCVANLMPGPQRDAAVDVARGGAGGHGGNGGGAGTDGARDAASDGVTDQFSLDLVANLVAPR